MYVSMYLYTRQSPDRAMVVDLGSPAAGLTKVDAVRPHLKRWIQSNFAVVMFRLQQVGERGVA